MKEKIRNIKSLKENKTEFLPFVTGKYKKSRKKITCP